MYRKDVLKVAAALAAIAGLGVDAVYLFVLDTCKAFKQRPKFIPFAAAGGIVYVIGDADNFRIEKYTPPVKYLDMYDGPDYEQLILQRQELQSDF